MEWLYPIYWAAFVDPPGSDPGPAGSAELDVDLVRLVYEVAVEGVACATCGADLDPAIGVEQAGGVFTPARTVVTAHCRGPRRHRHRARVGERAGELRLGPLRPA